jgi:hypothetical protein
VKLAAGVYSVTGHFDWDKLPESLSLPADTGLITLQINGSNAPVSLRDGQLWLKENQQTALSEDKQQNSVTVRVFRKISDELPMQISTRLLLEVSGEAREIKLSSVLLPDTTALALQSNLPARLDSDGQLAVQVRAGHWQLDLQARSDKPLTQLQLPEAVSVVDESEPEQTELWAFEARPQLRVVEIEQLNAIDTSQSDLPEEWKSLPSYSISAGQAMGFKEIRRGDAQPQPNQLQLQRVLWLDFDGKAYTANDTITGTMTSGWRLNGLASTQLGKVSLDGDNQLITLENATNKQGVEVRKGAINLNADSRLLGDSSLISAVGWEQTFHSVSAELNLPAGWRLLAASGVDNVPNSWLSQWSLLDLFLVLMTTLAVKRLWNSYWAGLVLITLTLSWHESDAPQYVWLQILACIALLRVLPDSRFYKLIRWYRNGCWLALVLISVPFMVEQVRLGIYPHLEQATPTLQPAYEQANVIAPASAPVADSGQLRKKIKRHAAAAMQSLTDSSSDNASLYKNDAPSTIERVDVTAKVQTGPGLPQWQWHKVYLSWNGAVTAEQQVHLWYLSPTLSMLLNFSQVLLIGLFALLVFGVAEKINLPDFKFKSPLLIVLLLPVCLAISPKAAYAELPSEHLLEQLKQRLQEQTLPDCLPSCAQIQQMQLSIDEQTLSISLNIHAQESVLLPLPAQAQQWFPSQVLDNNKPATGLYRNNDGLWLNVSSGEHQVILRGATPLVRQFSLPLPLKPKQVSVSHNGWELLGLQENGIADDALQFNRLIAQSSDVNKPLLTPSSLPAFFRIERTLLLGLNWRVNTQITRLSPADSVATLAVPLLAGEAVITEGIRIKDNAAQLTLSSQQDSVSWESSLEKSNLIQLTAPATRDWVEVWRADVSPLWHIQPSGIPMIYLNSEARWLLEWHPWAGEQVNLQLSRPVASQGKTLTIDNSELQITQGQRTREVTLNASIRSAQGTQHTLTLPENALLQSVAINGQPHAIAAVNRKLTLPLNPAAQTITVTWQEPIAISSVLNTSLVDLGQDSVNSKLSVILGQDRWVLFAKGASFGPVILFWSQLLVILLLSVGLAKVPLTPLKTWHWFLLLIGLSQVSLESASVVIAWLMLLGWRESQTTDNRYFNSLQVSLVLLSLLSLSILFSAVAQGLLSSPDMRITGNQSSAFLLNWYADRAESQLQAATIISLPILCYRLLMLAWSLWLAIFLLDQLRWAWQCFSKQALWHKPPPSPPVEKDL